MARRRKRVVRTTRISEIAGLAVVCLLAISARGQNLPATGPAENPPQNTYADNIGVAGSIAGPDPAPQAQAVDQTPGTPNPADDAPRTIFPHLRSTLCC